MFNLRKFFRGCAPAICAVGLCQGAWAGENQVSLRTYQSPDGTHYGALSIRPGRVNTISQPMNHVVLIDTSASQVGEYREQAFQVLESLLQALPAQDRVAVLAVDVSTVAMTDGLQAPDSARSAAMANLEDRFPAGSTNLLAGLQSAQKLLPNDVPGGIIYIGDGMSAAHLIQADEMHQLAGELRAAHIPVHSFAVGSNTDLQLLGVLGQQTGGYVMRDENSDKALTGQQVGNHLAEVTHHGVSYPEQVAVAGVDLLPSHALPMRSDRETVYLFEGDMAEGVALTVTERGTVEKFLVNSPVREQGNTFLKGLYLSNQSTDGLGLGLAADWMVNLAHQAFENHVAELELLGQQALATGNLKEAERIGFELQTIDPNNGRGRSLINASGEAQILQVQVTEPAAEAAPAEPNGVDPAREAPRTTTGIDSYVEVRKAKGEKLAQEVNQGMADAKRIFTASPDAGMTMLETITGNIKAATDIEPELREQLLRRIQQQKVQFVVEKERQDAKNTQKLVRNAEREAQRVIIDYQQDRDRQLEQMVNRIRALMDDAFHGDPNAFEEAETNARQIIDAYPRSAIGTAEVFVSEAAGQLDKSDRLRQLRADRFLGVLYEVEKSHVPFPDEPPILYPPAEVWQALTEMREQWKSVDLHQSNANERRIYEALKDTTVLEFTGNPLSDVVTYISTLHEIPIRLDEAALTGEGIGPDTEVKMVMSGISLRSALKLMLEDVGGIQLTYIIEDEVMKITTQTKADEKLQTRVYPVADLVIPVQPLGGGFGQGGGLGGGIGGQGGQGGQGGFGGGGQGGFGGGGGGFGGGGGGFGQFSVPAQPAPAFDASQIANAKKKLN